MRRFIIRTTFFLLPLCVLLTEGFLPSNTFTFRPWEALQYKTRKGIAFPFHPNKTVDMHSVGDLSRYSDHGIVKRENWTTDKLGYRNNNFIKKADVLLVGDSFFVGTSLPQDSTLTNLLQKKIQAKVYGMAPASFEEFTIMIEKGIIEKPKLLIYGFVERNLPAIYNQKSKTYFPSNEHEVLIFKDKIMRLYSVKYLKAKISKAKKYNQKPSPSGMYFLNGKDQHYHYDKIEEIAETIASYQAYCDAIGVKFMFLPLPNKETVYYDQVPLREQPDYMNRLVTAIDKKNIATINTLEIFNTKAKDNKLYYHIDDSHWNPSGVDLIAIEIANKLKDQHLLEY